jgi:hypothetical protein
MSGCATQDDDGTESVNATQEAVDDAVGVCSNSTAKIFNKTPVCDASGKLIPYFAPRTDAFEHFVLTNQSFYQNLPTNFPSTNCPDGSPSWHCQSYMNHTASSVVNANWGADPGLHNPLLVLSAINNYHYTGDASFMTLAGNALQYHLTNGMTRTTDAWAHVAYACATAGSKPYDGGPSQSCDGTGNIEPSSVAAMGLAFLRYYEFDGTKTVFLGAAKDAANALFARRIASPTATISPWPFRAKASTGVTDAAQISQGQANYTSHVVDALMLLDELIRLPTTVTSATATEVTNWTTARDGARTWLLGATGPFATGRWLNWFEDVPSATEVNITPMETAKYLMRNQGAAWNAAWKQNVANAISWLEGRATGPDHTFSLHTEAWSTSPAPTLLNGVRAIKEQSAFPYVMGSHTSRYAAVQAMLFELDPAGSAAARDTAYRSLSWASYQMQEGGALSGMTIDSQWVQDGAPTLPGNVWFTDGWGDIQRNFFEAMAAVPDFAPISTTHMLRSTSIVKSIVYSPSSVVYTTFDKDSIETIRVAGSIGNVGSVVIGGTTYSAPRADLAAEGYTWTDAPDFRGNPLHLLRVRHTASSAVTVNLTSTAPKVTAVSAGGTTFPAPLASLSLSAQATASAGRTISSVVFKQGATTLCTGALTAGKYTCVAALSPALAAGSYTISAVATDSALEKSTGSVNITVTGASGAPTLDQVASVHSASTASLALTGFFTTQSNDVLLALVASDGPAGAPISVTSVTGGGLTWTLQARSNTQSGTSEIWKAVAASVLTNATITAKFPSAQDCAMTLVSIASADILVDGAVNTANAATGLPAASLTTTAPNSWVFAVGNDWDSAAARTVGLGQTKVDEYLAPLGDTYWVQRVTNVVPSTGTSVTLNDVAPTPSNDRWNLALIEVRGH